MTAVAPVPIPLANERASKYFHSYQDKLATRVDRMLAALLALEWIGAIVTALILSPRTWSGTQSNIHPHVWIAILAGPAIVCAPAVMAIFYPARIVTRHLIAVCQMLMSALLIDVTNGRIETHFHVFGSLAFLACYRDWRVIVTASAVTALDHVIRGIWWPQAVYGAIAVSPWRWVEHAGWVVFEDIFLIASVRQSIKEMWSVAIREAQLSEGAEHDVLTGLANRRLLLQRFDRGLGGQRHTAGKGALLFVDLDRFKQVNDTLGHTVGDTLLKLVSARLAGAIPDGDTLARIGGDEFVVVLDNLNSSLDAEKIATRLLAVFNHPFVIEEHQLFLSASVGIAMYPEHGTDLPALQEAADCAMYDAKAEGRNRLALFSSEMTGRTERRHDLQRAIYQAIPRGELEVYFQPQLGSDREVSGFEALLRWTHPVRGAVPPAEFIPLAEKCGLMIWMGDWVLKQACEACLAWHAAGHSDMCVAVNVSALQFEQPEYARSVEDILAATGLPPRFLTLELTETVLLRCLKLAGEHLARLRKSGVRIALDDFGTGYSSLSYLQALPADIVKLDRTFVSREFADTPRVLESVIAMAHRLGLQVVAEGVETAQQSRLLRELDCDELQGYYFSKAVPASSVLGFLESYAKPEELAKAG